MNQSGIVYQELNHRLWRKRLLIWWQKRQFHLLLTLNYRRSETAHYRSRTIFNCAKTFLYRRKIGQKNSGALVSTIAHGIVRVLAFAKAWWKHAVFARRARSTHRYWKMYGKLWTRLHTSQDFIYITSISKIFFLVVHSYRLYNIRPQAESPDSRSFPRISPQFSRPFFHCFFSSFLSTNWVELFQG